MVDWHVLLVAAPLGLIAGVIGGMLGVGGSVIMIPGLVLFFGMGGPGGRAGFNQHAYQAAAMIANVAVALPAALRHRRAGAVSGRVLRVLIPAAVAAVLVGVWLSNTAVFRGAEGGQWLGFILALFLLHQVGSNLWKVWARSDRPELHPLQGAKVTPGRSATVGGIMGLIAGLLGVGGGVVAVPLQQVLMGLPLRGAIGNSAAAMVISATFGAIYKNASLAQHGVPLKTSLLLAAALAPTAFLGGRLGASLTHALPLRQVRIAFVLVMSVAAWRLLGLPWPG